MQANSFPVIRWWAFFFFFKKKGNGSSVLCYPLCRSLCHMAGQQFSSEVSWETLVRNIKRIPNDLPKLLSNFLLKEKKKQTQDDLNISLTPACVVMCTLLQKEKGRAVTQNEQRSGGQVVWNHPMENSNSAHPTSEQKYRVIISWKPPANA